MVYRRRYAVSGQLRRARLVSVGRSDPTTFRTLTRQAAALTSRPGEPSGGKEGEPLLDAQGLSNLFSFRIPASSIAKYQRTASVDIAASSGEFTPCSALDEPDKPSVLIVDEINRADTAKVFGELLFLLEYRDEQVQLQYSPEETFSFPRTPFLIGTMNTADRSIALVDAALRRRFYFSELSPTHEPVNLVLRGWLLRHGLDDEPALLLDALNEKIARDEIAIGPSYLMTEDGDAPDLDRVWEHAILPVLEEHLYGTDRVVATEFGLAALRDSLNPPAPVAPKSDATSEEPDDETVTS